MTQHCKKQNFVCCIQQLLQGRYRRARRVHLVLDNLNTHFAKVFVDVLEQKHAQTLLRRIGFHYTPNHGSWLNMAEIEIGILDKQCLNRRMAIDAELVAEVQAWQTRRNQQRKTIDWTFTRKDADRTLKKYYVA